MHPKVARALRAARRPYADGGPALGPAYLEPGEKPVEKPDTIYDVAMRYARALRNMGRTAQPGERGMILPIEATETGVKPAVPGIIAQPAEDWKGMVDSGYRPTGEAVSPERDRMAERSFNVAGVVPVAGLAAAAVRPGTSLGSGGGKLTRSLPMDEASRMARAREMGFDVDNRLYHGTRRSFDEFSLQAPDSTLGSLNKDAVYLSRYPEVADAYAESTAFRVASPEDGAPRVIDAYMRSPQPLVLSQSEFASIKQAGDPSNRSRYAAKNVLPELQNWWKKKFGVEYDPDTSAFQQLKYLGYSSVEYPGQYSEVAVFDPRNLRSPRAAFDPSQADSANILASNPSTASVLSLIQDRKDRE